MRWSGRAEFAPDYLPYELQPRRNRPRLEGLWDEFDAAVETLSIATTGHDMDRARGELPCGGARAPPGRRRALARRSLAGRVWGCLNGARLRTEVFRKLHWRPKH